MLEPNLSYEVRFLVSEEEITSFIFLGAQLSDLLMQWKHM